MSTLRRRAHQNTAQWPLDAGITVVLFAGLGGACAGLEKAGCPVHVANNHDPVALAAHQALHPHTRHVKGDIFDVDPIAATGGRRVKVLWASPDCRDHSAAKGGAPRSPRVRSLPWQVCRWAGKTSPEVIMMENVREIRGWGPLRAKRDKATGRVLKIDGTIAAPGERVPVREQHLVRDRQRLGRSYRRFIRHLEYLGYVVEARDLNCADFGVPTSRRRWFAVARRDGRPIGWPARTHAPANDAGRLGLLPHVPAWTIIDWSIPIPSIFDRARPLARATNVRIATGVYRYVLDNPRPFFIPLTHQGAVRMHDGAMPLPTLTTAHRGELAVVAPYFTGCGGRAGQVPPSNPEAPIGTITAKGDRIVCAPVLIQTGYGERDGQAPRALDIEAPIGTQVTNGGKHALVAAWMAQHNGGWNETPGHAMADPVSTLSTSGAQQQLAAGYLVHLKGSTADHPGCRPLDAPTPTLTAGGGHVAAVAAFLTEYYSSGQIAQSAEDPLNAQTTRMRHGVVTVTIQGVTFALADIGMRMLEPREAAAAHELTLPDWIVVDGKRRRLTKTEAMRLVGNSVPERMALLMAEANIVHALAPQREVAA